MTFEFLVFVNLTLLTRLFCLFKDDASNGRLWLRKTLVELVALLLFYQFSLVGLGAGVAVFALNFLGWRSEKKGHRRNLRRLLLGVGGVLVLSLFFGPQSGLVFRPRFYLFTTESGNWTVLAPLFRAIGSPSLQWHLLGLLLAGNEANLAIRAVFDWLDIKPRLPAKDDLVDFREFNRGRVIGILERALLYLFVLQGQYGAMGFVLTAKALTRFKAFDDRPFAEYVLIGTLLSTCLALATGGFIQWLMTHP